MLPERTTTVYIDDNIPLSDEAKAQLDSVGIRVHTNCCSIEHAGIQAADHASHALGSMLMEQMGLITKRVKAGENSGYHPDELIELGFELWASLRYALFGNNEYIEGLSSPPDDPANPYFRVEGIGLYISPDCQKDLEENSRQCFGINYLGCIH